MLGVCSTVKKTSSPSLFYSKARGGELCFSWPLLFQPLLIKEESDETI